MIVIPPAILQYNYRASYAIAPTISVSAGLHGIAMKEVIDHTY